MDHAAGANHSLPLQRHARMDDRIGPDLHGVVDVRGCGILEGDAVRHQLLILAPPDQLLAGGELAAAVDPQHFFRVSDRHGLHQAPATHMKFDDIRQVMLTLRVFRGDLAQGIEQTFHLEDIDTGVDFRNGLFDWASVPLLHNTCNPFAGPHDASVPVRVIDDGGQNRRGRLGPDVAIDQSAEGFRGELRYVAREQQERAPRSPEKWFRHPQRMGGSKLWLLDHKTESALPRQGIADLCRTVTDDDGGGLGIEAPGGRQYLFDHRAPAHPVQNLRQAGLHARALARGKDHDVES